MKTCASGPKNINYPKSCQIRAAVMTQSNLQFTMTEMTDDGTVLVSLRNKQAQVACTLLIGQMRRRKSWRPEKH